LNFYLKIQIIVLLVTTCIVTGFTQSNDSIAEKKHSPKTATYMSIALPGLGQIYNKKYWKVPLIYAAFGGCYYYFDFSRQEYEKHKNAYIENNSLDHKYYMDEYRRDRDLALILFGISYILNVVDASVDAHFFDFDVGEDISFNIQPKINSFQNTVYNSINLQLNF